jgi:Mlc titration factor MtfA (ptsG expression regulator)
MWRFILTLAVACVILAWYLRQRRRQARRERLFSGPFPDDWIRILEQNVPLYRLLPEPLRNELHGHINVFLDEKNFEGCGGLEVTDEIRVTIAAQACILLLDRTAKCYPRLVSIVVYPSAYVAKKVRQGGSTEVVGEQARLPVWASHGNTAPSSCPGTT